MKSLKRLGIVAAVIIASLLLVVPSFAAPGGNIVGVSQDGCTLNITVNITGDTGIYRIYITDTGLTYALKSFQGVSGQQTTVSIPVISSVSDNPITVGSGSGFGVDIHLMDEAGFSFTDLLDRVATYEILNDEECQAAYLAAQCAAGVIPEGAVVGALPESQLAYYAPGLATGNPRVFLNPGTYWIVDVAVEEGFYQILLACNLLWVPIDSMRPNYDEVWQGRPLPTISLK